MAVEDLETGAHQLGDAIAHAQALEGTDPRQHLPVRPALQVRQHVVARAREQTAGCARLEAEVGRAGEQGAPAPAVERHVHQGRLEQAVALLLTAGRLAHAAPLHRIRQRHA